MKNALSIKDIQKEQRNKEPGLERIEQFATKYTR